MTIREYNKNIEFLLPKKLSDYVSDGENCLLAEKIVEGLKNDPVYMKSSKEYRKKHASSAGQVAYSMDMLLTVVLAGSIDGVFQARKLARVICRDTAFIYLSGDQKPDHSTISRFKKNFESLIKHAFKITIQMAKDKNLLNLGRIAIDGAKYKANACLNKRIVANEDYLPEDAMEKLFTMDKEDDELYGNQSGDELPEELLSQKQIDDYVKKQVEEELKKEQSFTVKGKPQQEKVEEAIKESLEHEEKIISTTDKDSKLMKINKNSGFFYNVFEAVDGNHFIIGLDVTNETNDYNQFIPMYEQVDDNVGGLPEDCEVLVDNGFNNEENCKYCEENDINGFLQTRQNVMLMNAKKEYPKYSLINFRWSEEKQGYICPEGHLLEYQGKTPKTEKEIYYTTQCTHCPFKKECTPKGKYRRIYNKYSEEQRRMIDKMSQEKSETTYSRRMGMVEHIFGHEKKNLNITQLNHRGKDRIKTEKYLHAINYNINRYAKLNKEINEKIKKSSESSLQTTLLTQPINFLEENPDYSTTYNESPLLNNHINQENKLITAAQ
jgi:transposase